MTPLTFIIISCMWALIGLFLIGFSKISGSDKMNRKQALFLLLLVGPFSIFVYLCILLFVGISGICKLAVKLTKSIYSKL